MANKPSKPTKKDRFNQLLEIEAVKANQELVDFINHELELLVKKNAPSKKDSEKKTANEAIARSIVSLMTENPDHLYSLTELLKVLPDLPEDMSNQRMSSIVRTLLADSGTGEVERVEDKRKIYFKLAQQ